jgi:hypothetical protein
MPPQRVTAYYERVVAQVRAEQQVTLCTDPPVEDRQILAMPWVSAVSFVDTYQ